MGCVLIDESLSWVIEKEFRNDEKADIFLAVESLLKNVAAITIGGQFNDAPPKRRLRPVI
jgi:hypothetical protein